MIELRRPAQERIPRSSASLYGEICRANVITEEMVERYAPGAVGTFLGSLTELKDLVPVARV